MLCNKDQEYNNPLASFATCLRRQRSELRTCAKRVGGIGARHDFALMGFAFVYPALPTCLVVYVKKSDFHFINVFCVVIVIKRCRLLCLAQVVFSYFVLHSSKIPLVLTTKVTHLRSLLFRQPDGV